MTHPRFHLAIPVRDLDDAREFYGGVLGCPQGREDESWVDWNLYGHQLVTHLDPAAGDARSGDAASGEVSNPVDDHDVPVPHFGVLLDVDAFHVLAERVRSAAIPFVIEPYLRFAGLPGEQWTMFLRDPSGNALEFKAFADDSAVFAP